MASRAFEVRNHSNRSHVVIACGKCSHVEEVPRPRVMYGRVEKEGAILKNVFQRKGWVVGERERDDRCPLCATAADKLRTKFKVVDAANAAFKPPATITAVTSPPPPQKAKPSRTAVLALVREVRAKLDQIETLLAGDGK